MTNTNETKNKTLEELAGKPDYQGGAGIPFNNSYNILVLETMEGKKDYTNRVHNILKELNYSGTNVYSVWDMSVSPEILATGKISLLVFNWKSYWTGKIQSGWIDSLKNYLSNEKVPMPPTVVAGTENLEEAITKYLPINRDMREAQK